MLDAVQGYFRSARYRYHQYRHTQPVKKAAIKIDTNSPSMASFDMYELQHHAGNKHSQPVYEEHLELKTQMKHQGLKEHQTKNRAEYNCEKSLSHLYKTRAALTARQCDKLLKHYYNR